MAKALARYFSSNPLKAVLTPQSIAYTGSEQLGQAVQGIGVQLDTIAQRDESFWVQKKMADLDAYAAQEWDTRVNNATDGAAGFEKQYLGALDTKYEEVRNEAPTGRARAALESEIVRHRSGQLSAANGFATQEKFLYRKDTLLKDADNLSQELTRNPGVPAWQPQGSLQTAPGLSSDFQPTTDQGFYSTGFNDTTTGRVFENNIGEFASAYYSPKDFADGHDMADRSGAAVIGKQQLSALDWVTDQFGYGKLQINSGFRSGASNQVRAESGPDGPHTKGRSFDVQVRDLPQGEKDRLYSLFKAVGANAFGFGEGVMHVEWRDGKQQGQGRGGDFEWTYGSARKYNQIPVAAPSSRAAVASAVTASPTGDLTDLRPFQAWEYRDNGDGSISTEITSTVQDKSGQWVNVPTLWRNSDGWVQLDEEAQAAALNAYETANGQTFKRFATVDEAEKAAEERSKAGGSGAGSYNQYPYLGAVSLTAHNETGTGDLASASLQIATEANGTISVGALGLNSEGLLPSFLKQNGAAMGITAAPGTAEFAQQWDQAVRSDPEGVIGRQLAFHEASVIKPAQAAMQALGSGAVANDPRAIAFTSDLIIQYGAVGAKKHIAAGKGAKDAASYIEAITVSTKRTLNQDFATALAKDPSSRQGLENRIDRRAAGAMAAGPGGAVSSGNVPAWDGPIPTIEQMPNYADRLARLDTTVDTMGGTPSQRRAIKDQLRGQVVRSWLNSVADINPSAAMAVLMSGRYDNELTVGDTDALTNGAKSSYAKIEAEIRQKQKELTDGIKSEASQLYADEIASVSSTGAGLGKITAAHAAVATEKEKSDLAFASFAYATSKEINSASSDQLPAILEGLKPSGDGFAEELRRYDYAQQQVAARMEKQTNDPAALVLQQSADMQAQWKAAFESNDPVKISAAMRTARAAQRRMGVPASDVRSMPQSALANFEELLTKSENADEAFSNMMQIRGMFGPETGQVMSEMEAAGMAKGWSDVSGLVDAGHTLAAKALTRVVQAGEYGPDVELGVRLAKDGQADVARKIFDGRLRRKEIPGLMPTGKDQDLDMTVKQIIGDYLGNAVGQDGEMFNTVREAALSFYAADLPFGASLDGAKIESAIDKVTGGVLEFNADSEGGKFIAPVAGMTQSEFNDGIWSLDDESLKGAFVGYASEDLPLTRDDLSQIQPVSAGDGIYFLQWPGAGLARNADGSPFVLDYQVAVKAAKERAASAVDAAMQKMSPIDKGIQEQIMGSPNMSNY